MPALHPRVLIIFYILKTAFSEPIKCESARMFVNETWDLPAGEYAFTEVEQRINEPCIYFLSFPRDSVLVFNVSLSYFFYADFAISTSTSENIHLEDNMWKLSSSEYFFSVPPPSCTVVFSNFINYEDNQAVINWFKVVSSLATYQDFVSKAALSSIFFYGDHNLATPLQTMFGYQDSNPFGSYEKQKSYFLYVSVSNPGLGSFVVMDSSRINGFNYYGAMLFHLEPMWSHQTIVLDAPNKTTASVTILSPEEDALGTKGFRALWMLPSQIYDGGLFSIYEGFPNETMDPGKKLVETESNTTDLYYLSGFAKTLIIKRTETTGQYCNIFINLTSEFPMSLMENDAYNFTITRSIYTVSGASAAVPDLIIFPDTGTEYTWKIWINSTHRTPSEVTVNGCLRENNSLMVESSANGVENLSENDAPKVFRSKGLGIAFGSGKLLIEIKKSGRN